jgi:protein tyrosine/serine phosphatase
VLAAVLHALAGTPSDIIAQDYALTRVGIEPHREALTQMLRLWGESYDFDTPGVKELAEIKGDFILVVLQTLETKYGGVEGYVKDLGFEDDELQKIRKVLKGE